MLGWLSSSSHNQGTPDEGYNTFLFLNGKTKKDTMVLKVGVNYRFRIINITPDAPELTVSVLQRVVSTNVASCVPVPEKETVGFTAVELAGLPPVNVH